MIRSSVLLCIVFLASVASVHALDCKTIAIYLAKKSKVDATLSSTPVASAWKERGRRILLVDQEALPTEKESFIRELERQSTFRVFSYDETLNQFVLKTPDVKGVARARRISIHGFVVSVPPTLMIAGVGALMGNLIWHMPTSPAKMVMAPVMSLIVLIPAMLIYRNIRASAQMWKARRALSIPDANGTFGELIEYRSRSGPENINVVTLFGPKNLQKFSETPILVVGPLAELHRLEESLSPESKVGR